MNAPRRVARLLCVLVFALASRAAHADGPGTATPAAAPALLESFADATTWTALPADGVEMRLSNDDGVRGRCLRVDYRFTKGSGWAVARHRIAWTLPERYRLHFRVRGTGGPQNLEFKLVDASGDNVWWANQRDFHFPAEWGDVWLRDRHVTFAWGPLGGGRPRDLAYLEFAVTAGSGGAGTVWLDDLELETLPPQGPSLPPPSASASSARPAAPASAAVDSDSASAWSSAPGDTAPALTLDLGELREFGGLTLDWRAGTTPGPHAIEVSEDGAAWRTARIVRESPGGREHVRLPESEARYVRVRALARPAGGWWITSATIRPLAFGATPDAFVSTLAREAPRGDYPRAYLGEQSYWTVVGLDRDPDESLLDEDARIEIDKQGVSLEPFLAIGSGPGARLLSWADGDEAARLEGGDLPIPSVRRTHGALSLDVTALADGEPGASRLLARYRVRNDGARRVSATLFVAIRPFQVNPPQQFLNTAGGWSPIRLLEERAGLARVNGAQAVRSLTPPSAWGAATQEAGGVLRWLHAGRVPPRHDVRDETGGADGAFAYALELKPGEARDVVLEAPRLIVGDEPVPSSATAAADTFESRLAVARGLWHERLHRVRIELPPSVREVERTLRAQIGWILVNRDGPALQPGSRAYERSWIRDGALTSSALLRLGHAQAARDFLEWFAPYQYDSGKIPCCVDQRGSDAVPEHDAAGEFIFLVAEVVRCAQGDDAGGSADGARALADRYWPRVRAAAAYLDSLRATRRTPAFAADSLREYFGLLPPSISHEGYSAKPMHSYWDDLFALRGFEDAAWLAGLVGRPADAARLAAIRDEFAHDLAASIERARARHGIAYIPGCADLGDFDATSTAIGVAPLDLAPVLPSAPLDATFDGYMQFFRRRRDGVEPWEAMTPYETRIIGALVRLGRRGDAHELLDWFLTLRRPPGFAHWAEVVDRDARHVRFLGDMPHTWVGSDFARSVLDMFCYERSADGALVLGAGVPWTWAAEAPGVRAADLPTPYGRVDVALRASGDSLRVDVAGARVPPGGFVLVPPARVRFRAVTIDGRPAALESDGSLRVRQARAAVVFSP